MQSTIQTIIAPGKGILAADESTPTCTKRFKSIGVESTEESRRDYRVALFTTPNISKYLSGVILFEETLMQKTKDGTPIPKLLEDQGIVPGIKVDKGLIPLQNSNNEKTTQGLDGLPQRLEEYKKQGAKFAKWRCVYQISKDTPTTQLITTNAEILARYAAICQEQEIVPIVEPEVLIDGDHSIQTCAEVSEKVFSEVFTAIKRHKGQLQHMILKPSMVISGLDAKNRASTNEVANKTLEILKKTVPEQVPTINFLSGGQTPKEATSHLNLMNQEKNPWNLSFSYSRALQGPALKAWAGNNEKAAQDEFLKRAKLCSLAQRGEYNEDME